VEHQHKKNTTKLRQVDINKLKANFQSFLLIKNNPVHDFIVPD
jgi:hypothetical protein